MLLLAFPCTTRYTPGRNATIFVCGSRGTGKSFTMSGSYWGDYLTRVNGIISYAVNHIFEHVAAESSQSTKFRVQASVLDIFNEEIRDLLGKHPEKNLSLKHGAKKGTFVKGLSRQSITNNKEMDALMLKSGRNRRSYVEMNTQVCVCVCVCVCARARTLLLHLTIIFGITIFAAFLEQMT